MAPELSVAPRYWTGKQIMFFVAFSCFTRGHRVLDFFVLFRVFSWPRTVFSWPFRVFRGRFRAFVCQFFRVFSCFFVVENAFFVAFSCFFVARSGASIVKGVCRWNGWAQVSWGAGNQTFFLRVLGKCHHLSINFLQRSSERQLQVRSSNPKAWVPISILGLEASSVPYLQQVGEGGGCIR